MNLDIVGWLLFILIILVAAALCWLCDLAADALDRRTGEELREEPSQAGPESCVMHHDFLFPTFKR